jgi:hypothetical protein
VRAEPAPSGAPSLAAGRACPYLVMVARPRGARARARTRPWSAPVPGPARRAGPSRAAASARAQSAPCLSPLPPCHEHGRAGVEGTGPLLRLVRDRCLDLPDDESLRKELFSLRLSEGTTPGVLKLTTDGSSAGHFDRVTALMLAAEELLSRGTGSYRDLYGEMAACDGCNRYYPARRPSCQWCGQKNEAYQEPATKASAILAATGARAERNGAQPVAMTPGGWAAAYYPPNAVKCDAGHIYDGKANSDRCPQCVTGTANFLRGHGRPG